jgi:hypothetical protein
MTEQEQARDRATRELARRLHAIAPDGLLTDIDTFAAEFVTDMTAPNSRGRWCYVLANPGFRVEPKNPDAYERGPALARNLLNIRKDPTDGNQ